MRFRQVIGLKLAVALTVAGCGGPDGSRPVRVERGVAQLFIDDLLIAGDRGLVRVLHQPVKDAGGQAPLIEAAEGTTLLAYGSIVHDRKLGRYVMFVQEFPSRRMYRTTSADGLNWDAAGTAGLEPVTFDTDLSALPGAEKAKPPARRGIDLFSCCYDAGDPQWPYKGWLYLANWGNELEGVFYVYSADGRDWKRGPQVVDGWGDAGDPSSRTIRQDGRTVHGAGDVTLFGVDPAGGRYLGIFKFLGHGHIGPDNGLRSRAYLWLDRLDARVDLGRIRRVALLPPVAYAGGDTPFDEYYASTAWKYESMWLGGLKIYHSRGHYPHSAAGCAFLKLVAGRDGLHWRKVPFINDAGVPEVFLANGPEGGHGGRNDGGYISEFSQGPLRIGDELVYYYSSSSFGKHAPPDVRIRGGGVFRARLRTDGFVSVQEGTLTTPPLRLEGVDLTVNAVGPVSLEVVEADGRALASAQLEGDSLRHAVSFDGRSLGQVAGGRLVRLRFTVRRPGRLYSFTVR